MLDIKLIKEDVDKIIKKLNTRGGEYSYLKKVVSLDKKRIEIIQKVESIKAFRNEKSKEIGILKSENKDKSLLLEAVLDIGNNIKKFDNKLKIINDKIKKLLLKTPNVPRGTVPFGIDEKENVTIKLWGKPTKFNFKILDHAKIATKLELIDFNAAIKITGSRFALFKNVGAKLHRALAQYLLDKQTIDNGYTEFIVPYIVNQNTMENTGQLPKFENDLFKLTNGWYLIPTSEVPITNIHKNEVIDVLKTIKYCSYSPCFRSEVGSAGKDVKGIIRQHQFHKVELMKFSHPNNSLFELDAMTNDVENILKELKLPYRVIELCTGDIGFSSSKTYDIEVWLPSYNDYKEISSCSNMSDFQSRRANIKYRNKIGKLKLVHTLNGSGLPIGRTLAAILENYQQFDGSVVVPDVLVPYLGMKIIK